MTAREVWRRVRAGIDRRATPRAIVIAGYAVFLLYAFPGFMTVESAEQLMDARTHTIGDWNSPMMSVVWWLVEAIAAGSFGMLALQSALFLAGAYVLAHRVVPARRAALAACAALLFPPVIAPMVMIWRDAQMAGFLLAGAAAVTSEKRPIKLVGLVLLFLACGMRETAAFAALPIVVLGFAWRDQRWWRRGAIAVAAWLVVALGAAAVTAAVTEVVTLRDPVERATFDIIGVLRYSGDLDDAELRRELAGTPLAVTRDIQARARQLVGRPINPAAPIRLFDAAETPAAREAILAARGNVARAHPSAYLVARWHLFYRIAAGRFVRPVVFTRPLEQIDLRNVVGQMDTSSWTQRRLIVAARWLGKTWLFLPGLYFALAAVLLPIAVRQRQRDAAMLLASGIAHAVGVLFLAIASEYRLAHWTIACVWLAAILLIARRFTPPTAPAVTAPAAARS
jgi:hypothetical protein